MRSISVALLVLAVSATTAKAASMSDAPACRGDGSRVALLVGNQDYARPMTPLENPRHDVDVFGTLLCQNGFSVYRYTDLSIQAFDAAIDTFATATVGAKTALVYYSGHGFAAGRKNWLVPTDAKLNCEDVTGGDNASTRMSRRLVDLDDQLFSRIDPNADQIVILDACRTDPVKGCRGGASPTFVKGLERHQNAAGRLIVYATQDGQVALDSIGGSTNSPLMTAMAERLSAAPKREWVEAMLDVSREVAKLTRQNQRPNLDISLPPQGCLAQDCTPAPLAPPENPEQQAFVKAMAHDDVAGLNAFLEQYSIGALADLARRERDRIVHAAPLKQVNAAQAKPDHDTSLENVAAPAPPAPASSLTTMKPPEAPAALTNAVAVQQRAAFLIEAPEEPTKVKTYVGTVTWEIESTSTGDNQPLTNVIKAKVSIPDAKMDIIMRIEHNTNAQFPATHTIEFKFALLPGNISGNVNQINVPAMRSNDAAQVGTPLSGVPLKITDGFFLVGLSRGEAESKNLRLMMDSNWFDLTILFDSGKVGKVTFEQGAVGRQILNEAFKIWQSQQVQQVDNSPFPAPRKVKTWLIDKNGIPR